MEAMGCIVYEQKKHKGMHEQLVIEILYINNNNNIWTYIAHVSTN